MTEPIRIIPRLDIKGPNLVKGIHLEGLRVLGKPWDFAYKYYQDGADELLYMDIVASLYGRNNLIDIVKRTAENIFIPITVGGGIRNIEDIKNLLRSGADKVAINTAAIHNPQFIKEAASVFGSQCIVISIEAKKIANGYYEAFTDNGREKTGLDVFDWAKRSVELGAGELLVTSIDNEGTGLGYDLELIHKIAHDVTVPVIASGGAGQACHFSNVINSCGIGAVSASSLFHYQYLNEHIEDEQYALEGNIEFIRKKNLDDHLSQLKPSSIQDIKQFLLSSNIFCRMNSGSTI